MTKPNLFIIGVAKAGTTYLHQLLNQHPSISMSRMKEPHFFLDRKKINIRTTPTIEDLPSYLNEFDNKSSIKYLGDASPSYAWDLSALRKIKAFAPEAKIILMLRDPFDRAYSHYQMEVHSEREQNVSFKKALENDLRSERKVWGTDKLYLDLSHYGKTLEYLHREFELSQFLVLSYEAFFVDLHNSHKKLLEFLNLPDFEAGTSIGHQNKGSYSSQLMKRLKKLPGRRLLPQMVKVPLKKFINRNARPISHDERALLLPMLFDDLKHQQQLGYTYYTKYL